MGTLILGGGAALLTLVGLSEWVTWRVHARQPEPDGHASAVVLVLGFPSRRDGGPHPVQRWRAAIGVRTLSGFATGTLVFSGAATRDSVESEAAVMARYAVDSLGVSERRVRLEETARSTWENVSASLSMLEGAEQIAIASDPLHAEKARRYLVHQRPDLAARLVRAADYRLLERWWLKIVTVGNYGMLRARGSFGQPPSSWGATDGA